MVSQALIAYAEYEEITVKEGTFDTLTKRGIHLLSPDETEVEAAIEEATNTGQHTVYVYKGQHFPSKG